MRAAQGVGESANELCLDVARQDTYYHLPTCLEPLISPPNPLQTAADSADGARDLYYIQRRQTRTEFACSFLHMRKRR